MTTPDLAEALARPRNAFTMLRLTLAAAVVVSHAFSVTTGQPLDEPLTRSTGFTLGEHAVNGFFALSGFLVTMSFCARGARDYVIARSLRILPGLVAATLLVALVLGACLSRLPAAEYYASPDLWTFIRRTLTSFKSQIALPGLFEDNPYRSPLGTVWTLKYESFCYLGVLGAGLAGLLRARWPALLITIGLALALVLAEARDPDLPKGVETALRLPMIFAGGGALYLWRDRVRLTVWPLLLLPLALVLHGTPFSRALLFLGETYAVIWLAFLPALARPALEPAADLSYGVYLYGWPIQQSLHALWPAASAWTLLGPSLVLSLLVAAASWYTIEKPALGLKSRWVGRASPGPEPAPR